MGSMETLVCIFKEISEKIYLGERIISLQMKVFLFSIFHGVKFLSYFSSILKELSLQVSSVQREQGYAGGLGADK